MLYIRHRIRRSCIKSNNCILTNTCHEIFKFHVKTCCSWLQHLCLCFVNRFSFEVDTCWLIAKNQQNHTSIKVITQHSDNINLSPFKKSQMLISIKTKINFNFTIIDNNALLYIFIQKVCLKLRMASLTLHATFGNRFYRRNCF